MEPTAFEGWVGEQLKTAGYLVSMTPWSGDKGADLIARRVDGAEALYVQCKHSSTPGRLCSRQAVEEVLNAIGRYGDESEVIAAVVTNCNGFTRPAQDLAGQYGVKLLARDDLHRIALL